jgi:hypothetical protein
MMHSQRRKRLSSKKRPLPLILRWIRVFLSKWPDNAYSCVGFSLILGILASLAIWVFIHQFISKPKEAKIEIISSAEIKSVVEPRNKVEEKHAVLRAPSYEILLNGLGKASPEEFRMPGRLARQGAMEGYIADYGQVDLHFFEEEGASRQIYHEYYDMETDFRHPSASRDDDIEL